MQSSKQRIMLKLNKTIEKYIKQLNTSKYAYLIFIKMDSIYFLINYNVIVTFHLYSIKEIIAYLLPWKQIYFSLKNNIKLAMFKFVKI